MNYYLARAPAGEVSLTFLDPGGMEIKSFSNQEPDQPTPPGEPTEVRLPARRGMNSFVWDMRHPSPVELEEAKLSPSYKDPPAALSPPGTYQARLDVDGDSQTVSFDILKDPRVSATQQELEEQFALQIRIRDKVSEAHDAVYRLRSIRRQVDQWARRAESRGGLQAVVEAAEELKAKLSSLEEAIIERSTDSGLSGEQVRGSPRLQGASGRLAKLADTVGLADGVPTRQSYDVFNDLAPMIDDQLVRVNEVVDTDVEAFINLVHELEVPEIVPESTRQGHP